MKHLPATAPTMDAKEVIYDFNRDHYATAEPSRSILLKYQWTCGKCGTKNTTRKEWIPGKTKLLEGWKLETRCGHCHAQKVRLIDSLGRCFCDFK